MTLANNRARRIAVVGALAAAAALPALAALTATTTPTTDTATGNCLAWFGSRDDGQCLSYSNGQGGSIGTPGVAVGGSNTNGGLGVSTGPLMPGQTISIPMG
ncbi:MAG: hypothetical protein U0R81_08385 [Mycobacterium sp.]